MIHENTPAQCLLDVLNAYGLRGKSRSDAGQMLIEAAVGHVSVFTVAYSGGYSPCIGAGVCE